MFLERIKWGYYKPCIKKKILNKARLLLKSVVIKDSPIEATGFMADKQRLNEYVLW